VQVGRGALVTLTQGSLRDAEGIQALEEAAAELYKALQAGRDRGELGGLMPHPVVTSSSDMAATMERLQEYRTHNLQFCKRLYEYSSIMFTAQVRPSQLRAHFVMKSKGCPPVNVAIRRFEWSVEAQRTRQIGN
jgi:Exocyst complex component Sec3